MLVFQPERLNRRGCEPTWASPGLKPCGNTVQVSKNVAGNTSDLKDSITVTIVGTRQADGSIKATTIQIGNGGFNVGSATPAPSGG